MKQNIFISLGLATMLAFTSCGESFLYKAPQGSISESAFLN